MEYRFTKDDESGGCLVALTGDVGLDDATATLEALWENRDYGESVAAIWDLTETTSLPDFNDIFKLVQYIGSHRRGRGPRLVAFVSPGTAGSLATGVFEGFDRTVGFNLRFFADVPSARTWITEKLG